MHAINSKLFSIFFVKLFLLFYYLEPYFTFFYLIFFTFDECVIIEKHQHH